MTSKLAGAMTMSRRLSHIIGTTKLAAMTIPVMFLVRGSAISRSGITPPAMTNSQNQPARRPTSSSPKTADVDLSAT